MSERGPLHDLSLEHCRLSLHVVEVASKSEVDSVPLQQRFDAVLQAAHHPHIGVCQTDIVTYIIRDAPAAAGRRIHIHRSMSAEDDPGGVRPVDTSQVFLEPSILRRAHRVVVLCAHTYQMDGPDVIGPPRLVGGSGVWQR